MTMTLSTQPADRIELGFGRVLEGHEAWMFGEYFPQFGPVMASHGLRTLVSFAVVDSNADKVAPTQGSLGCWPSAGHRDALFADPVFAAVLPRRDAALQMSDGHLFEPLPTEVRFDPAGDYAIVVASDDVQLHGAVFRSPLASDSLSSEHEGRSLCLLPWTDATAALLAETPARALVLRVRLNPPQA
jgi:hypothetical protein